MPSRQRPEAAERRVELKRLVRVEVTKPDGRRLYLYERKPAAK